MPIKRYQPDDEACRAAFFLMCPVAGFLLVKVIAISLNINIPFITEDGMRFMLWGLLIPIVLAGIVVLFSNDETMSDRMTFFSIIIGGGGLGGFFFMSGLSDAGVTHALVFLIGSYLLCVLCWAGLMICYAIGKEHITFGGHSKVQKWTIKEWTIEEWTIVGVVVSVVGVVIGLLDMIIRFWE